MGQTALGMKSRRHVHLWNARETTSKSHKSYVYNWIRKHGEENMVFEVLEKTTPELLDEREAYWIQEFKRRGNRLVNIKPGGGSERGYKVPRLSERMRGEGNPMYGKDRREIMAHARSFQKPMTAENRARVSERSRGELNVKAKLTEQDVREIRSVEKYYGVNAELGRKYGVSGAMISAIRMGKFWTHVV